jgi:NAD(P)-dependent dehydrogenase (short-subunit alcohol dehydrogenase family)
MCSLGDVLTGIPSGSSFLAEIQAETSHQDIHYVVCNLSSLVSVREAAADFRKRFNSLDILINNAALTSWGVTDRTETEDGLETFWATNCILSFIRSTQFPKTRFFPSFFYQCLLFM